MTGDGVEQLIRRAIGGDGDAMTQLSARALGSDDPELLVLAALLGVSPGGPLLDGAAALAVTREDRQLVAIARAHFASDRDLVDALARDHLVDFPGSYLVAWVAAGAPTAGDDPARTLGA